MLDERWSANARACLGACLAALLLVVACPVSLAAPPGETSSRSITPRGERPPATAGKSTDRSNTGSWWSTAGSLALVVAVILALGALLRLQSPLNRGVLPQGVVQDLGRKPLDARHTLHLVRCGSRILVLGASTQGLSTLAEITDPVEVDALTGLCQPRSDSDEIPFSQTLRRFLGMSAGTPAAIAPSTEPEADSKDFAAERLKHRLQQSLAATAGSPTPEAAHV